MRFQSFCIARLAASSGVYGDDVWGSGSPPSSRLHRRQQVRGRWGGIASRHMMPRSIFRGIPLRGRGRAVRCALRKDTNGQGRAASRGQPQRARTCMVSVSPLMLLMDPPLVCMVLTVADIRPPPPPIIARRRRSFSSTSITGSGAGAVSSACSELRRPLVSGIVSRSSRGAAAQNSAQGRGPYSSIASPRHPSPRATTI
jgi:hypothetical protein